MSLKFILVILYHFGMQSSLDKIKHIDIKLICQDKEYQYYLKVWKKATKISCQLDFLKSCVNNQVLPKGIYDQSQFTLSYDDPVLKENCCNLFLTAGSRILDALISSTKLKKSKCLVELDKIKGNLNETRPKNEFMSVNEQFHKVIKPVQ